MGASDPKGIDAAGASDPKRSAFATPQYGRKSREHTHFITSEMERFNANNTATMVNNMITITGST